MKTITLRLAILLITVLSFFSSCKKSDTTSSPSSNAYTNPTLKDTIIPIPQNMVNKASSDYNLELGVLDIEEINGFGSALSGYFVYGQSTMAGWKSTKNSDGSTSYSWTAYEYTIKLTYYSSSSDSWWKYEEDSANYSYPLYYVDYKGTSGETDWYYKSSFKSSSQLTLYKDIWSIANGVTNSTFNWYANDGVTISSQYVAVSNADKSGSLKVYSQNNDQGPLVLNWYYTWTSAGTGSYTNYNSDGSTVNFTGTF